MPRLLYAALVLIFFLTTVNADYYTIVLNSTVSSNLTNFPARVDIPTVYLSSHLNSTHCANIKFIDSGNELAFDVDDCNLSYANITYWVRIPTLTPTKTIYAQLQPINTSYENVSGVWGPAGYVFVWHANNLSVDYGNTTGLEQIGSDCNFGPHNYCFAGKCVFVGTGDCYFKNLSSSGLPTGNSPGTQAIYVYMNQTVSTSGGLLCYGAESNNNARLFYPRPLPSPQVVFQPFGSVTEVTYSLGSYTGVGRWYHAIHNPTNISVGYNGYYSTVGSNWNTLTSGNLMVLAIRPGVPDALSSATDNFYADEARISSVARSSEWLLAEQRQTSILKTLTVELNNGYQALTNISNFTFTFVVYSISNTTVRLYINNTLEQTWGQAGGVSEEYTFTKTLPEGNTTWYVFVNDTLGNMQNVSSWVFVDSIPPVLGQPNFQNNTFYFERLNMLFPVNESNDFSCSLEINGSNVSVVKLNQTTCAYNITQIGNFTVKFYVKDIGNNFAFLPEFFIRIFNYSVTNVTPPAHDIFGGVAYLNFTLQNFDGAILANLTLSDCCNSSSFIGVQNPVNLVTFSYTTKEVSAPENLTALFQFYFVGSNHSANMTRNITLYPAGLLLCNNTYPTYPTLNIIVKDIITGALVNSTITVATQYHGASKTTTYSFTNKTFTLCGLPPNRSFNTSNTFTVSAPDYEYSTTYASLNLTPNQTTNFTIFLTNTTQSYILNIQVLQPPLFPVIGAKVQIYKFTPPDTYEFFDDCVTDAGGQCQLRIITQFMYFYNITYQNIVTPFGPESLSCTGVICYRTFRIGTTSYLPPHLDDIKGECTYFNTTNLLTCQVEAPNNLQTIRLYVHELGNVSAPICNTNASASTGILQCVLSSACKMYAVGFYGSDAAGNTYQLAGGQIQTAACTYGPYGQGGWMLGLALLLMVGLAFAYNISTALVFAALGFFSLLLLKITPFGTFENYIIGVVMIVIAAIVAYRMRV